MKEEVIELSVEDTNALRAKLGLKPLQIKNPAAASGNNNSNSNGNNKEELSLSIEDSNNLRQKLGLPPLRIQNQDNGNAQQQLPSGRKASEAIHAPAQNTSAEDRIKERIAEAKLKREVEAGIAKFQQDSNKDGDQKLDALSWADQMRAKGTKVKKQVQGQVADVTSRKMTDEKKRKRTPGAGVGGYSDADFENQNLTVSHNTSDFDAGTTTVLTLADTSILEAEESGENALENVNMSESATMKDNLKRKREVEMGIGHAGGYTGYDDDEFEELGGSQMTLGIDSSKGGRGAAGHSQTNVKQYGFRLNGQIVESGKEKETEKSDLFATFQGKSVSLVSSGQDGSTHQADFMSYEEEEAMGINMMSKEEIERKRRKKEKKLLKKLKKDKKRSRKERKELVKVEEDQTLKQEEVDDNHNSVQVVKEETRSQGNSLLEELAAASKSGKQKRRRRTRRVETDSDDSGDERPTTTQEESKLIKTEEDTVMKDKDELMQEKRKNKFHDIMEKGNQRTHAIFSSKDEKEKTNVSESLAGAGDEENEEEDDAFLSAAISKARRLRRLRELSSKSNSDGINSNGNQGTSKGANAVVEALESMKKSENSNKADTSKNGKGNITFELGTTTEFTRALRAQPIYKPTDSSQKNTITPPTAPSTGKVKVEDAKMEDVKMEDEEEQEDDDNTQTLEELADQVKEETDTMGALGSTGTMTGVGRGMSAFLGMLKQTGEISGKTAGREELRGRAKDERTYDDYAPTDLKKVVKLDTTGLRNKRPDKDIEFANKEIKLEYRDEHGRLLTRKEAYRQLCYQFHGHGSSKKKEEKRLQQIEREQYERSANTGNAGTLGALKATQKATGKAFVLHKT